MKPADRDVAIDYEALQRKLLTPAVEALRVCDLYFRRGHSAKEIAVMVNKSESAVRGIVHRCRRKLGLA